MAQRLAISFEGAARTVTGSRHRITHGGRQWLFDCGVFQGPRDEAERINRSFRFEPASLDAVVVSHAHLDHIGNLPTLTARGYAGPIHATPPTADLAQVMLEDSAFLMQRDVEHVNRHRSGQPPRRALYTPGDVAATLTRMLTHEYQVPWTLFDGVEVEYHDAGHILGAATTVFEFRDNGRRFRLGMGGDLGRPGRPLLRDPEIHAGVDALVLESTYGDRVHPGREESERLLAETVTRTVERGGRILVPAFAVGRAQELVAVLNDLIDARQVPEVPIFVDSPMAREATTIFKRHPECFDDETRARFAKGHDEPFGFARLRYIGSADESRALNDHRTPCVIISASGMCEGGRILHHLLHSLGDPRNTVLFVGFQAEGTLGRRLREGAEQVNIFGEPVRRAAEVVAIEGFSAHADREELIAWVRRLEPAPRRIFLVHGEPGPADALAAALRERTPAEVHVPEKNQEFVLWS